MNNHYKNKDLLVIDLGSYSLKLVSGRVTSKGIVVRKAHTIPMSPGIYLNGDIVDKQEFSNLIRDAVKENGYHGWPVVFTFGSSTSVVRVLELPKISKSEIKDVVDYEMQQYLPADSSMYLTQYRILPTAEGVSDNYKIMAGTIPRVVAENLFKCSQECNLVPYVLDMHPNALGKLLEAGAVFNKHQEMTTQTVMVVDFGHSLTDISIFEKGQFQFNRRLNIGGKSIDARIQRVLDVSASDAQIEKHQNIDINQKVFEYTEENRVFNAVKSGVDEWLAELEKIVKFCATRKNGKPLDCCYIYGGSSGIGGIEEYVKENLGLPTEKVQQISGVLDVLGLGSDVMLYLNAIGAMIRKEESK